MGSTVLQAESFCRTKCYSPARLGCKLEFDQHGQPKSGLSHKETTSNNAAQPA
jgi:hypothetical protein